MNIITTKAHKGISQRNTKVDVKAPQYFVRLSESPLSAFVVK